MLADPVPPLPVKTAHMLIDSYLNPIVLQAFITGLYTWLFIPTILPLIRKYQIILVMTLGALYTATILNLVAKWIILRRAAAHNAVKDETITLMLTTDPEGLYLMDITTRYMPIFLADCLLIWRCLVIWQKNKRVMLVIAPFMIAEFGILLTSAVKPDIAILGPLKVNILVIVLFISAAITSITTSLIIHRILSISRSIHTTRPSATAYQFTVEVLVESGMLYTTVIIVCGILGAVGGGDTLQRLNVGQGFSYFNAILTPITGIAPTLITDRILSGNARADSEWEKPLSELVFKDGITHDNRTIDDR